MKNTLNIILHDLKLISSSVVSIVVILGLCIIPCLYAWFNILSNWDPYEKAATSRIQVAVASDDKGADILGLNINVGEKLIDTLRSNDDIGWIFTEKSDEAIKGVRSGDFYAALLVPKNFTKDILTFATGELLHPQIKYYENEKKNAIAPKITSKAKSALKKEIDAAFVQTLGKYASEAQSVANEAGLDPKKMMGDLGDRMDSLSDNLGTAIVMMQSAGSLIDASNDLLTASENLIGSSENALDISKDLLDKAAKDVPDVSTNTKTVTDALRKESAVITSDLDKLTSDITKVRNNMDEFNKFVESDLESRKTLVSKIRSSVDKAKDSLEKLGLRILADKFARISDRLGRTLDKLNKLEKADAITWSKAQTVLDTILSDISEARSDSVFAEGELADDIDSTVEKAVKDAQTAIKNLRGSLTGAYGDLKTLSSGLANCESSLITLKGGIGETVTTLVSMQSGCRALSNMFSKLASSDAVKDINHLLEDDTQIIAENLASPIKMDTKVVYPVKNFGSMMTPFYTVLAQWVGALLSVVLISVRVKRRKGLDNLKLRERFFGRFRLFLGVGIAQALIVTLGELLYLGIQCEHPFLFILAACVNGITFMMINYAVVFAFDNIGLAINVIILVIQVAGSGGTYPVEVLPGVFQFLYPFMPFHYAMDAMRECVAGMYGHTYIWSIFALLISFFAAAAVGLLLYRPMLKINKAMSKSMQESDLLV